jgi:hypothetical protein
MGVHLLLAIGRGLQTDKTGGLLTNWYGPHELLTNWYGPHKLVTNWYGSHEISLSDHRYTLFKVGDLAVTRLTYCNMKRNNWES